MPWGDALPLAATQTEVGGWKWADLPPAWVLTLAAIALFLFLRALYRRERGRAGLPTRIALAALRTGILLLLLLVLAGPYREEVRTAEERSHLVLLVDASGSMGTSDRYAPDEARRLATALGPQGGADPDQTTRLGLVQGVLGAEGEHLLRALDRRFVLHAFAFDVDWRGLGSTREEGAATDARDEAEEDPVVRIAEAVRRLDPAGGGTDFGAVLRGVAGEFLGREDRRLAGVLLFTDGRDTSSGDGPLEALAELGESRRDLQVTAVALGNPSSGRNLRVERIRAMDWVLIEDDVVFETALRHQGFTGLDDVRARLEIEKVADVEGKPVVPPRVYEPPAGAILEAGPFRLPEEDEPVAVRLRARMREPGVFRVRVRALLPPEAAKEDAVREDDVAEHEIRVVDQRIKVLYVENLPRYEYRFLSNWLTREPEPDPARPEHRRRYEVQVLLQSADPTVEQRASPGVKPLRSFPRQRRELFEYDVLIFGDVAWRELGENTQASQRILELVREFVREGGGIAFQAGANYGNPLGFRDTPLHDLLPINPKERDKNASERGDGAFRIELTDVGRRHPVFAGVPGRDGGLATPEDVARIWRGDSSYSDRWVWWWMYRAIGGLRPGAIDLARARPVRPRERGAFLDDTGRPVVVFALMGYGKGRVFWSALDSISRIRWGLSDRFYGPFWDQLIRHLATYRLLGGNKRFKISTDKETYFAGETATVTITALDADFEPLDDPYLSGVHVENPDADAVLLEGEQRPASMATEGAAPGTYRMYLPLRRKGTYRVWISDTTAGRERGLGSRAERRIEVVFRAPELRQTIPDHDLLLSIVKETEGRLVGQRLARLYDLDKLAKDLPARATQRVLARSERTQWDKPWVLLLLVGLLALEWLVRKRWQMI